MSDDSKRQPTALGDILARYEAKKDGKYISREFQDYGYRLAVDLDDLTHTSLYIRLAKTVPRAILEAARGFVVDAPNVQNKAKLFMWKMKELRAKA
jgi:hypothetical protein